MVCICRTVGSRREWERLHTARLAAIGAARNAPQFAPNRRDVKLCRTSPVSAGTLRQAASERVVEPAAGIEPASSITVSALEERTGTRAILLASTVAP